jgi:hypothetical protein
MGGGLEGRQLSDIAVTVETQRETRKEIDTCHLQDTARDSLHGTPVHGEGHVGPGTEWLSATSQSSRREPEFALMIQEAQCSNPTVVNGNI